MLFCGLAPACALVKLRCLFSLFTIIFSNSLLMLLHNHIPLLFSNFLLSFFPLSRFININIFHWCGISSESKIILKKVCSVCVRTSSPYFKNSLLTSSGPSCLWLFNVFVAHFTSYNVISLLYSSWLLALFVRYFCT